MYKGGYTPDNNVIQWFWKVRWTAETKYSSDIPAWVSFNRGDSNKRRWTFLGYCIVEYGRTHSFTSIRHRNISTAHEWISRIMGFIRPSTLHHWTMGWSNKTTACSYMVRTFSFQDMHLDLFFVHLVSIVSICRRTKPIKNYAKNWFKRWKWAKHSKALTDWKSSSYLSLLFVYIFTYMYTCVKKTLNSFKSFLFNVFVRLLEQFFSGETIFDLRSSSTFVYVYSHSGEH